LTFENKNPSLANCVYIQKEEEKAMNESVDFSF